MVVHGVKIYVDYYTAELVAPTLSTLSEEFIMRRHILGIPNMCLLIR